VKDGQPPKVGTFGLRALPQEWCWNVTMNADQRKKVIDGVDIDLKEYYVEPATAQQVAAALKAHESKGDYDAISDGDVFAARLTDDMQEVSHDRHLPWTSAPSRCRRGASPPRKTRRGFTTRWNTTIARSTS